MAYSAEEFETVLQRWAEDDLRQVDDPVVTAALRIATAVMRPGVIEEAMGTCFTAEHDYGELTFAPEAAAIRAALTREANNG